MLCKKKDPSWNCRCKSIAGIWQVLMDNWFCLKEVSGYRLTIHAYVPEDRNHETKGTLIRLQTVSWGETKKRGTNAG